MEELLNEILKDSGSTKIMKSIVSNIFNHPEEEKFRRVKKEKIKELIGIFEVGLTQNAKNYLFSVLRFTIDSEYLKFEGMSSGEELKALKEALEDVEGYKRAKERKEKEKMEKDEKKKLKERILMDRKNKELEGSFCEGSKAVKKNESNCGKVNRLDLSKSAKGG